MDLDTLTEITDDDAPRWTWPDGLFTTPEICALTGVTYRMLDYWVRIGVVVPDHEARGSGTSRGFGPKMVGIIRCLGQLNTVGAGADQLRAAFRHLTALDLAHWQGKLYITPGGFVNRKMTGPVNLVLNLDKTRRDALIASGILP